MIISMAVLKYLTPKEKCAELEVFGMINYNVKFNTVRLKNTEKYCNIIPTFQCMSKGSLLHKDGKGVNEMTQSDLILRLVEMLLEQKEQNNNQPKVEENKRTKD